MGVHPSIIVNGYSIALEESIKEAEKVSRESDEEQKSQVVRTSLQGKGDSSVCGLIASLAVEAADGLMDLEGGDDLERMDVKVFCSVGRVRRTMRNGKEPDWDTRRQFPFSELMRRRQLHL